MTDRLGSIRGQITIDGKEAPGLEVTLLPATQQYPVIETTKTDVTGRYRFAALPSGRYWLKVIAPLYVNAIHWDKEGPGRNVSVADGQSLENADLDLVLGGVIAGRITDAEGNPVVGEYVELSFADRNALHDDTLDLDAEEDEFNTDSNGLYRIYGIPPGRYLISIGVDIAKVTGAVRDTQSWSIGQVSGNQYFEQTFYPGVSERARARVIDISPRAEIRDVNMTVGRSFRAYTVSGRVIDAENPEPIRQCYLQLGHYTSTGCPSSYSMNGPSDTDQEGNFRVEGLLPGRFFVSAQFEGETEFYCAPVEFEIKGDDINGLEIKAYRGLTISGTVAVEGVNREEATVKLAQLKLRTASAKSDGGGSEYREAAVNSDGSFTIRGLRPGHVSVSLGYGDVSWYFSMVRIEYLGPGGVTQAFPAFSLSHPGDAAPLLLGETGLKGVRIVLLYKNGSIKGHVTSARGKLDSDTRLKAGISQRSEKGGWSTSREVDVNGNFVIDALEPGVYTLSIDCGKGVYSETKTVIVNKDSETRVSFAIDLSASKKRD